jgi:hypothetical protein
MLLVLSFISAGKEHYSGEKLNGLFFLTLAVVGLCVLVALVATYISTGGLTLNESSRSPHYQFDSTGFRWPFFVSGLLGAHEANPFVSAAISSWGVIAGLLYKKTLACALLLLIFSIGFRHPSLAKTSIDCDRIRLYIGRGRLSVGDSAIRNHSGSGDHARQNCSFR